MTELIINEALNTFPFLFVGTLPAQDSLRFSKQRTLLRIVLFECGYLCIFGLLVKHGFPAVYVQYLAAPLGLVLMLLNFRSDKWIILFHFIFMIDYLLAIRAATFFLCENNISIGFYSWQAGLVTLIITLSTMVPMSTFLHEILKTLKSVEIHDFWMTAWLLPFIATTMILLLTGTIREGHISSLALLARILLLLCMFMLSHLLILFMKNLQTQIITSERNKTMENLLRVQTEQFEMLKTRILESRRARHDFRHHRMVLQDMADRNDLHGIQTYLAEFSAEHADRPSKTYSNNPTVNAVVAYYAGHAEAAGIRFTARVQLLEHLLIPDPIFCVLLGNLLENAVDACKTELSRGASSSAASAEDNASGLVTEADTVPADADSIPAAGAVSATEAAIDPRIGVTASADVRSDQAIRVIVKQSGDACLSIAVDNTCSRKPIWDDDELVSTKHEGHGVGTVSIRYIAKRYDGDARFEWRDGIFYASVMLNPQSPPNP